MLMDRADIFLEDNVLRRGRPDHVREPAPVGWPPGGSAGRAAIVPQQKRFETALGGLEIPDGIFTGPAQSPDGFVFDLWNLDRRELPRAH